MSGILSVLAGIKTAIATAVDEYFNRVTLLLPGDGTNGAQNNTFLDSSTNNFTITRNGNTTQGTFSPFSQTGWSTYFGSTSDRLGTSSAVTLGNTWTFECWFNATKTDKSILVHYTDATGDPWIAINQASSLVEVSNASTTRSFSVSFAANTWHHLAITCNAGTLTVYLNGVQQGATQASPTTNMRFDRIAGYPTSSVAYTGYISNMRATTTVVYSANFTPPTAPLTAITGTQFLGLQSNRFLDNSSNAYTVSVVAGTPSVQAFSPFAPTAAYSAATNGGSGYFDGTGDYLTSPNSTATDLPGDFTIELWWYPLTLSGTQSLAGKWIASNYAWLIQATSSNLTIVTGSGSGGVTTISNAWSPKVYSWHHILFTRSGTSIRAFVNGVQVGTTQTSSNTCSSTAVTGIGANPDGPVEMSTGYISGFRVLKGTAQYTSNFTPPTAPPTAITNTSLLLNFTNAGITDATAKNVLETVGNAQISTTQSKFGGSSMYFDGTGDSLFISDVKAVTNLAAFRTGDFTIEMWVYPTANPSTYGAIPNVFGSSDGWGIHYMPSSAANPSTIRFDTFVSTNYAANNAVPLNQWTHIAVTRSGSSLKFWVNGTQSGSTATVTENFNMTSATFSLGNSVTVSREFFGYIDDFRITKGYARYTSNFTPPSAAFALQ